MIVWHFTKHFTALACGFAEKNNKKECWVMKKFVAVLALSWAFALPAFAAEAEKVPVIRMAYTMTTHQQGFKIGRAHV